MPDCLMAKFHHCSLKSQSAVRKKMCTSASLYRNVYYMYNLHNWHNNYVEWEIIWISSVDFAATYWEEKYRIAWKWSLTASTPEGKVKNICSMQGKNLTLKETRSATMIKFGPLCLLQYFKTVGANHLVYHAKFQIFQINFSPLYYYTAICIINFVCTVHVIL